MMKAYKKPSVKCTEMDVEGSLFAGSETVPISDDPATQPQRGKENSIIDCKWEDDDTEQ